MIVQNSPKTKTERVDDDNTVLEVTFKDQGRAAEGEDFKQKACIVLYIDCMCM